jgi:hypothetical protein
MSAGATNLRNLALWREFQGDEARSTALALSFGWPVLPPLLDYFTVEANRSQFVNHSQGQLLRTIWAGRQQDPEHWGNRSEPTDWWKLRMIGETSHGTVSHHITVM